MMAAEKQNNQNVSQDHLCTKLLEIVEHTKQGEVNLKCDVCKNNAVIILCTVCAQCLCKACHRHHNEKNNDHDIAILDKTSFCPEHKKNLEYYCEKCDEFACSSCKEKHSNEVDHNLGSIEEKASKHRNTLAKLAAPIDDISKTLSQTEDKLTTAQKNLEEQVSKLEQSIDNQYEVRFEELKERCDLLKRELSDVVSQQKKELLTHLEEVKSTQNEVIRVMKLFDDLKTTSDQQIISTKEQTMELQVQMVTNQCNSLSCKPVGSGLITFDPATKPVEILGQLFMDVKISNLPKYATKDETVDFLISTEDKRNQYCTKSGSRVSVQMTSSTGIVTTGEVRDNNDGSYRVSIKVPAEEVGEAKLSACIDGLEIKGSPFSIEVIQSQDAPTRIVDCDGRMGNTWGIAIAKNGMWAVTDVSNHCVYIFNSQNELVHIFGQKGSGKGEFNQPFGLAFDSNNHLYVVDGGNHRVQKFDTTDKYLLEFGTKGNNNGQLEGPYGIITHCDKVYVADFTNKRISVFKTDGQFYLSFGSDHLHGPRDVAINTNDQLFVADHTHIIYTFTLNGDLVNSFGKYGILEGELNYPLSVATWNEKILISDQNHCVSIFSEDGQFVRCLGSTHGAAKGQLNYPHGVASKANSIYVTDLINQRVQIFNLPMC